MEYRGEQNRTPTASGASRSSPFFKKASIQPKLRVNTPGDSYEQEADAVADQVMRAPETACPAFQRKCAHCEEEEMLQRESVPGIRRDPLSGSISTLVQRKTASDDRKVLPRAAALLQSGKGSGHPLPDATRNWMEGRFGTDFSDVKVRKDERAVRLSEQLGARAFTYGSDIYFNRGEFAPNTVEGKRLLAHELTHVIQQTSSIPPGNQMIQKEEGEEGGISDTLERASMEVLDTILPVGNGFYFEINGGITWGYPIYTGGSAIVYVDRVAESSVRVLVRKQGRLAFDTGVGGSLMIGRQRSRGGNSSDGIGVGAEAGANFMAGVLGTIVEEYSIPTERFLLFVGAQAVDATLSINAATTILSGPVQELLGQDADQYMTRQQVEAGVFARADAEAGAGLRRPTDSFNGSEAGAGNGVQSRARTWGPQGDRDFQGSTTQTDPISLLNSYLGLFLSANVNAQLVGGFEERTSGSTTTSAVYVEGQVGAMIGIPIPVVGQFLSSLPPDAGGGVRLEFVQSPGESTQIRAIVYLKQGEDQYYAGAAGQQNMVFNLTNIVSVEELGEALRQGRLPSITGTSFSNVLEKVSFFNRLSLGGANPFFERFLRRQQGTRSLLSNATLSKARRTFGVNLEIYLDYGGEMEGPDFISIAERLISAGAGAVDAASGAQNLPSAYEQLSRFFSGYISSEEFSGLTDDILDQTAITTAKLRIQVGAGVGIAARLAEGAKVRGDLSAEAGMSCELDYAALLGGRISFRTVLEGIGDILEDPVQYLPDCPILRELYNGRGGGTSSGSGGTSGTAASAQGSAAGTSGTTAGGQAASRAGDPESASGSRSSSGRYAISNNYPENAPPLTLRILEVHGPLRLNTPVNTVLDLDLLITTAHVENPFRVSLSLKVIEISSTEISLELMEPWWINELSVGSDRGAIYTLVPG